MTRCSDARSSPSEVFRLCVASLMTLLMPFQVAERSIGVPCEIALDATTDLPFGYRDLGVMIRPPREIKFH